MIDLISQHETELNDVCRRFHVKKLEVFGSAVQGDFDPSHSDIDFLLELLPEAAGSTFHGYFELKTELERLFGRKVDLLMPRGIRNRFLLQEINRQREVVYAA